MMPPLGPGPDAGLLGTGGASDGCVDGCCEGSPGLADAGWLRAAGSVRGLSWVSLAWMSVEGALGLAAGVTAGSAALVGWALSSVVEGLASVIVIWRFTGSRTFSEVSEGRAQRAVAVSFWVLAPYVAVGAVRELVAGQRPSVSVVGIALTAVSVVVMPVLGLAKHRLARRLGSSATAGEGTQNLLCACLGGAVLVGLAANAAVSWWWLDPLVALAVAGVAVREGTRSWRGETCEC